MKCLVIRQVLLGRYKIYNILTVYLTSTPLIYSLFIVRVQNGRSGTLKFITSKY